MYIYTYICTYIHICICLCVRVWGGGHEGGENKTYCQDLRENLTEKGGKRKISVFYKIIHNFFLEYKFASIFSLNHLW